MNRRKILEIASETGIQAPRQYHIIDFATRIAQLEREACALLCYEQRKHWDALACADAIRAGTKPRGQA
jgi:hypothetical protein